MNRLRQRASQAFTATVGFLAGMAVMAVLMVMFRASAPEVSAQNSGGASAAAPASTTRRDVDPAVAPSNPDSAAIGTAGREPAPVDSPPLIEARPSANDTAPSLPADAPPEAVAATAEGAVAELRTRHFEVPVRGATRQDLQPTFDDARTGHKHEALDLLAPRNTPVVAVEDGTIAKLFNSRAGGITVYQFDPTSQYAYYYAHLERYADGLSEGDTVKRGQVIGYVGTSGNAPANTPHLHFAIFKLTADKRWWQGTPIDPYEVLR